MRIGILTRDAEISSTRRLLDAIAARELESAVLPVRAVRVEADGRWDAPGVPPVDGVIARIGSFMPGLARAAARAIESSGIPVLPSPSGFDRVSDKWGQLVQLSAAGLPVPRSVRIQDFDRIDEVVRLFEGRVVWKPVRGDRGRGVEAFIDPDAAAARARERLAAREEIYAQAVVPTGEPPRDLRVIVVGDEVVAAMTRIAAPGEFASNLHLGGRGERVELGAAEEALAIDATRAFALPWAGVDLVRDVDRGELHVLEVNASPGLDGVARATGVDVAAEIVDHAIRRIARG